jgi:hypothetical protein
MPAIGLVAVELSARRCELAMLTLEHASRALGDSSEASGHR